MTTTLGVWIVVGICALPFALAFTAYLVAKFATMGRLAGARSFITFRGKRRETHAVKD